MTLFNFNLKNVESITPWGEPGDQSLSWFALTDGAFRMNAGDQVLFRYSDAILAHWGSGERDVDYQIASIARDILDSVASGTAQMPPFFEALASNWDLLTRLDAWVPVEDSSSSVDEDIRYHAWRWLGERSPWTSYFVACPKFQFVRIRDEVHIHWDNRKRLIKEIPVWTAHSGCLSLPLHHFVQEAQNFADRLLKEMDERIQGIEAGRLRPQIEVSTKELRRQHEVWRSELALYFSPRPPDLPWELSELAVRQIAKHTGVQLCF